MRRYSMRPISGQVLFGTLYLWSVLALSGEAPAATHPKRLALDAVSHIDIEINRPPAAVWPHIVNSNSWTRLNLLHHDGPVGEIGEVFAIVYPAKPDKIVHLAENIELAPNRRRTLKLYDQNSQLRAYVMWTLEAVRDRTLVSYDVFYETVLAGAERERMNDRSILAQQRQEGESTLKARAEAELSALKRLVESK